MIKTEENQEIAASKAGMDAKTARKYRRDGRVRHYIKRDLQPYLPVGYPNPLRVPQHHGDVAAAV